jgi:cobalt-zinc-cadmium efflux system membrane fusion protein
MTRNTIAIALALTLAVGGGAWVLNRGASAPQREQSPSAEAPTEIALTAEQIAAAGIAVEQAAPTTIRETLPLYGSIAVNAERSRDVAARYPGTVRNVAVKIGDAVKEGATLATVESNESLQGYVVKAPIGGVVTARTANQGEQTGDKVLFTVADLSTVWVELALFPRDAAKVHIGQSVVVSSTQGEITGDGSISYLAPVGNGASQTRSARVLLDNRDGRWAPGLYVTAQVLVAAHPVPIAVSTKAVQNVDGKTTVFVRTLKGFVPRPLAMGRNDTARTEVLSGLNPGESYATDNSFVLKSALAAGEADHD